MKRLNELNRDEKILLLEQIQQGNINRDELTPQTWVMEKKDDVFIYLSMAASSNDETINKVFLNQELKNDCDKAWGAIIDQSMKSL